MYIDLKKWTCRYKSLFSELLYVLNNIFETVQYIEKESINTEYVLVCNLM